MCSQMVAFENFPKFDPGEKVISNLINLPKKSCYQLKF